MKQSKCTIYNVQKLSQDSLHRQESQQCMYNDLSRN